MLLNFISFPVTSGDSCDGADYRFVFWKLLAKSRRESRVGIPYILQCFQMISYFDGTETPLILELWNWLDNSHGLACCRIYFQNKSRP